MKRRVKRMALRESNGVRLGLRVRDLDGKDLGRVKRLYDWGFAIEKGFPILFRRDTVATYDEVRGFSGDVLTLARSDQALFDLAEGGVPSIWRLPVPHGYPAVATPAEARAVVQELAGAPRQASPPVAGEPEPTQISREEERAFMRALGQADLEQHAHR